MLIMDLSAIFEILTIIAIVTFIVLAIYVMVTLNSATKLIDEASKSLERLSSNLTESIKQIQIDTTELKERLCSSLESVDKLAVNLNTSTEKIGNEIDRYIEAVSPFNNLIKNSYNKVAAPLSTAAVTISAVSKAINTFYQHISKKKLNKS